MSTSYRIRGSRLSQNAGHREEKVWTFERHRHGQGVIKRASWIRFHGGLLPVCHHNVVPSLDFAYLWAQFQNRVLVIRQTLFDQLPLPRHVGHRVTLRPRDIDAISLLGQEEILT